MSWYAVLMAQPPTDTKDPTPLRAVSTSPGSYKMAKRPMEELEIVNAKIVVAVGSDAFSDLTQRLPSEPLLMPHYSNRYVAAETLRAKIDEVLSAVATARAALAMP